jgi:predicted metalloprotease with PDZ domain
LLWLDADTLIRKMTDNRKSLDDFEKIFLGEGGNTGPLIVTYTFDDLVKDLNKVVPYDWAKFLRDRVHRINDRADLEGIDRGGYQLVYEDKPTATERTLESVEGSRRAGLDCWYSVGLQLAGDGRIRDVRWGGPADKARLAPGEKIIAVDGQVYSPERMAAAIGAAKNSTSPIRLIVQADSYVSTADIDYHDGNRYPVLKRVESTQDYIGDIIRPLTSPEKAPPPETPSSDE